MKKTVATLAIIALFSISLLTLNLRTVKAEELVGDVNGDGMVNLKDVLLAGLAFGSTPDSPKWNQHADINSDNMIDMLDIYAIASHFGEKTTVITLTVRICPRFLNLRSRGRWINAYIRLPEGYNASDIDVSSIRLN
ncbi:MAG TPA: dockerin type I domain-containing protein, partial [Acidobacteriota bacterium]|nr:dockerin type I domain-containing protein [Acidobacteriota bacterium]